MKFRKKPVTIEAIQWAGNIGEVRDFMMPDYPLCPERGEKDKYSLIIHTLEGDHEARWGDWIIKGIHGEFYPCKPDIFAKTYEKA